MRKVIKITFFILMFFAFTSSVSAISIFYQNQPIKSDVQPQIVNGRTLVPIRAITDALNGTTTWYEESQTVEIFKNNLKISLKIGEKKAIVGNEVVELDVPAQIISNRTFVPLRFVSEHFGHRVDWDEINQRVLIDSLDILVDLNNFDYSKIYEIEGTGKYAGYKRLVGHPYDDKFAIYYQGGYKDGILSYNVTFEEYNPKNLQEKISWSYNGKTYTHTRSQLYSFFSDIITLERLLGQSEGIINQDWLAQTFGETYIDWLTLGEYSENATRIVDKYLQTVNGINYEDRFKFQDIDLDNADWDMSDPNNGVDPLVWISDKELTMKTELTFSRNFSATKGNLVMAFIKTSHLTGTVLEVVYEVPDMPLSYLEDNNDSEDTFNGIRFKKVNGNIYFNREDLKNKGIL